VPLLALSAGAAPAGTPPATPVTAPAAAGDVAARKKALDDLVKEAWEGRLQRSPIFASMVGDKRWNDKVDDFSLAAIDAELAVNKNLRERFTALDVTGLPVQDQLDREIMLHELDRNIEGYRFKDWEMPVNQVSGIQILVPQLPMFLSFETVKDFDDYAARLEQVPRVFEQCVTHMRQGMKDGLVPPRILLEKSTTQTESLAALPPEKSPLVAGPLAKMPKSIGPADAERIKARLITIVREQVQPAYVRLAKFLRDEYLPKGLAEPGVWALPDGAARYAFAVAESTTTKLTPDQIHDIGLREVATIEKEMLAIGKRLGFKDLKSFQEHVRDDPKLRAGSRDRIVDLYKGYIAALQPELPKFFGHLPKAAVIVEPVEAFREKESPDAEYSIGLPDGSRPARVVVNTYDPEHRSVVEIEATAYHEGVPGHHLQLAMAQELPALPPFRQYAHFTAFIEGWALYSERLARDVGFYKDPYSDYGRLQSEMLRAIRLVVDTGFHAKKWSRAQVVKFFHDHSAIDEISVQNETDRYIAWPAQALAYKVGQLKILELRDRAEKTLGKRFDIRRFHDEVIDSGALPLDVLERRVNAWIAAEKRV
jgi:uncharacterized protein (DUF885 family)